MDLLLTGVGLGSSATGVSGLGSAGGAGGVRGSVAAGSMRGGSGAGSTAVIVHISHCGVRGPGPGGERARECGVFRRLLIQPQL